MEFWVSYHALCHTSTRVIEDITLIIQKPTLKLGSLYRHKQASDCRALKWEEILKLRCQPGLPDLEEIVCSLGPESKVEPDLEPGTMIWKIGIISWDILATVPNAYPIAWKLNPVSRKSFWRVLVSEQCDEICWLGENILPVVFGQAQQHTWSCPSSPSPSLPLLTKLLSSKWTLDLTHYETLQQLCVDMWLNSGQLNTAEMTSNISVSYQHWSASYLGSSYKSSKEEKRCLGFGDFLSFFFC